MEIPFQVTCPICYKKFVNCGGINCENCIETINDYTNCHFRKTETCVCKLSIIFKALQSQIIELETENNK